MKLYINDSTNSAKSLYYQSLILLFLPCEKFGIDDNENSLYVNAYFENGKHHVSVKLEVGERVSEKSSEAIVDYSVYSQMKNLIGRTILDAAYELFGIVPPWGISTGVKPVKLARRYVRDFDTDAAIKILCEEYRISRNKAKMAVEACKFEDKLMEGMGEKPYSLYISIPFCPSKCNYCSFVSCTTPRLLSMIPDYILKIRSDLEVIAETVKSLGLNLKSVYIGGGTPAILDEFQIDSLLTSVFGLFDIDACTEFTFEAGRPDCITQDKLRVLDNFGIPRICINTQSSNDEVLRRVGRSHNFADYVRAMETARKFRFKCINTDLISGLPSESFDSFCKSVRDVASLEPENITVHAFTLKKSSNFRVGGQTSFDICDGKALDMSVYSSEYLDSLGYNPYYVYKQKNTAGNLENAGYSKPGFESIYNVIMMGEYHTVFGAGAGSVTKIVMDNGEKVERIFAPKYPYEYLDGEKYSGFDMEKVLQILNER